MKWFRVYGDMPDDPKIGTLTDAEFRTWVELLCLACREEKDGHTTANTDNINWLLRRNVTEALQTLLHRKLVTLDKAGAIIIAKWQERQMLSDSSAKRVSKFREKQKSNVTVTLQKRSCNGLEERREEKNRGDKKKEYTVDFLEFWETYPPNLGSKSAASKVYQSTIKGGIQHGDIITGSRAFSQYAEHSRTEKRYIPHASTWLNECRWEVEYTIEGTGGRIAAGNANQGGESKNIGGSGKPSPSKWIAEGERLAAKYEAAALRQGEGITE